MPVRTRFAPSPTGHLHLGGARTALYAWLHARHCGGQFVLRIEDTDRQRSTPEYEASILEAMAWLDLDWDLGPIRQTERFARYAEALAGLVRAGHAYHCDCPRERLEAVRAAQLAAREIPRYDGRCRERDVRAGADTVIRLRTPADGEVVVEDLIHGTVRFANAQLDDLVLARADATPTYNFCVVVDDLDGGIDCVIRGDDHLNNTPRQVHIWRALGADLPRFAHVPMILGADGQRLSKRHGDTAVLAYRERGYLPGALLNYLARLGWAHGDQEIFSRDELIAAFEITAVHRAASTFNPGKLDWLNAQYLRSADPQDLVPDFERCLKAHDPDPGPDPAAVITALRERASTLGELAAKAAVYYREAIIPDPDAVRRHYRADLAPVLADLIARLEHLPDWTAPALHQAVKDTVGAAGIKFGALAQLLRVALTGTDVSPGIDVTLALSGRQRALKRLHQARESLASLDAPA